MTIRNRLARLERQARAARRFVWPPAGAALAGRVPCPPGFDTAEWESRQRIGDCLMARADGRLPPDGYLSEMTPDDRAYVDATWGAIMAYAADVETAGLEPPEYRE